MTTVRSDRLEILPLSADAIDALLQGDAGRLRSVTGAEFPLPVAPPPYMADSLPVVRDRLRAKGLEAEWWNWLIVRQVPRSAVPPIRW